MSCNFFATVYFLLYQIFVASVDAQFTDHKGINPYASIVTDSATLKATLEISLRTLTWCRHSSAYDLDRTKLLNKLLLADVVSLWLIFYWNLTSCITYAWNIAKRSALMTVFLYFLYCIFIIFYFLTRILHLTELSGLLADGFDVVCCWMPFWRSAIGQQAHGDGWTVDNTNSFLL